MPSISSWKNYDRQTVATNGGVDHAASAKENLAEAQKNLSDMFSANHFHDAWAEPGDYLFGHLNRTLAIPELAAAEVGDVLSGPVKAAKNTFDAAMHTVANAIEWK